MRNCTLLRDRPLELRNDTLHPFVVGADDTNVRNVTEPLPGVGGFPLTPATSGSKPPDSGRLSVGQATAPEMYEALGTFGNTSLSAATAW